MKTKFRIGDCVRRNPVYVGKKLGLVKGIITGMAFDRFGGVRYAVKWDDSIRETTANEPALVRV